MPGFESRVAHRPRAFPIITRIHPSTLVPGRNTPTTSTAPTFRPTVAIRQRSSYQDVRPARRRLSSTTECRRPPFMPSRHNSISSPRRIPRPRLRAGLRARGPRQPVVSHISTALPPLPPVKYLHPRPTLRPTTARSLPPTTRWNLPCLNKITHLLTLTPAQTARLTPVGKKWTSPRRRDT